MEKEIIEKTLEWLVSKRIPNPLSVTLTVKQRIEGQFRKSFSSKVDKESLSVNIRHFMNRLNKSVYGSSFNRYDKRLSVIPVFEGNDLIRNHIHLTLQRPDHIDLVTFEKLISDSWLKTKYGYQNICVKEIYDYRGWLDYQLKSKSKGSNVSCFIDWGNLKITDVVG
jgi:hypothetical protein